MRQLPEEAFSRVRMGPPRTSCPVGGALPERLTENRILAHTGDLPFAG